MLDSTFLSFLSPSFLSKSLKISSKHLSSKNLEPSRSLLLSIKDNPKLSFFSDFETSEEVNMVKSFISSSTDIKSPSLLLIYQDVVDSADSQKILESIDYCFDILMIMETKNGEKFGFFFDKQIAPNKDGYYKLKSDKCFLFSFKNKKNMTVLEKK